MTTCVTRFIAAFAIVLTCASSLFAQSTGTLTGVLTDEQTGAPLVSSNAAELFFTVYACVSTAPDCNSSTPGSAQAQPDANGRYIIQNLAPGSYLVRVLASLPYITEIHPNIPCVAMDCTLRQGSPVSVAAGVTTTVDFALSKGATIAGTVRRADTGAGVYRAIFVYNAQTSQVRSYVYTDQAGVYSFPSLPPGDYYVHTGWYTVDSTPYLDVLYPNITCRIGSPSCSLTLGSLVSVTTGATTTIDFLLPPGGSISGRVTAADSGAPVGSPFSVSVKATNISLGGQSATAGADGTYTLSGLRPGRYYVSAAVYGSSQQPPPYRATSFGNPEPQPVDVPDGAVTTGVDIALVPQPAPAATGSIRGTITTSITSDFHYSGHCARVAAYDAGGHFVRAGVFTREDDLASWPTGYAIDALLPGTYYVRFENPACYTASVWAFWGGASPDQTYGAGACITDDCDVRRGAPVTVTAGATATGIDFGVTVGQTIGVVPDTVLYDWRGVRVSASRFYQPFSFFGGGGSTAYIGLPDGTYYARTVDGRLNGGVTCPECPATAGRPIVIRGASVPAAFESPAKYQLSGTVRDAVTNAPLSTVAVDLYNAAGGWVAGAATDALGRYEIGSGRTLVPGTYFLRTRNTRGFADRLYSAVSCAGCEPTAGTPVTIVNADVAGIDFALPGGGLAAIQTIDANGVGFQGPPVVVFGATGQRVARESVSFDATAGIQLVPGAYYARTEPASGYVMTTYGGGACARGACDPRSGTSFDVTVAGLTAISIPVPACTPGDISPSILASAVIGRSFRQVFRPSTPDTFVYVSAGRIPAGLTLDAATGVFAGTPAESGVFTFRVASVDPSGCAFVRQYTLQVAQCAFILSPDSATVSAGGGPVTVTASDVCGYATVTSQAPWITADAASAGAATPLTVAIDPNPLAESRVGTLTIGRRVFTVRQAGQGSSPPFGFLEAPANGAEVSGSIGVSGWVLDDVQVTRVRILRDAVAGEPAGALVYIGDAVLVDGARPDVERVYPALPFNARAGWGYLLLTNMLPNQGNGTFVLHAFADDAEGHSVLLGSRTIVAANNTATGPFGAIDTPAQGETIAGAAYRNWGWALTRPSPRFIPTGGSTIHVMIDGVLVGTPVYNLFRPDVAGLFPGLANSGGPVGYRDLDTTALGEGVHTIAWIVYDHTGQGAGIGSRYFTVRNSADAQPSGLFTGTQTGQRAASVIAPSRARTFRISPLQQLRVNLAASGEEGCSSSYSAYLVANGGVRDLPAGAAMSAAGEFTWQPGPAFSGAYEFAMVSTNCRGVTGRQSLVVRVEPSRSGR